ncbi:hypothetical protein [Thiobacter aerophilum]|uniref:Uncharacterized protein n=1 Tax=Thiobacter aerophilum TaxID=3121275 RepID=A0ABV0EHC9_9BURK
MAALRQAPTLEAGEPLWKRVPTRDEAGRPLADFMMLIPGLRDRPQAGILAVVVQVRRALAESREVVFAHLDLRLNLLWVSVRARPGITLQVAARIRERVPEARLIGQKRFY